MNPALTLFHTSATHVARFGPVLARIAPGTPVRHVVNEELLSRAVSGGESPTAIAEVEAAVDAEVRALAKVSRVLLCTCSTVGGIAERLDGVGGARVVRVDRPLAQAAVSVGKRIAVVAALESTLRSTWELIEEEAQRIGREVQLSVSVAPNAWRLFLAGDQEDYLRSVARHADEVARGADVVVLAQASMLGAEEFTTAGVPVLSSPELGLRRALELVDSG